MLASCIYVFNEWKASPKLHPQEAPAVSVESTGLGRKMVSADAEPSCNHKHAFLSLGPHAAMPAAAESPRRHTAVPFGNTPAGGFRLCTHSARVQLKHRTSASEA